MSIAYLRFAGPSEIDGAGRIVIERFPSFVRDF
jgi:hypothetical protein